MHSGLRAVCNLRCISTASTAMTSGHRVPFHVERLSGITVCGEPVDNSSTPAGFSAHSMLVLACCPALGLDIRAATLQEE